MNKEQIRSILELFISWNGETDVIDVANLDSAIDFINESLSDKQPKHSYFTSVYHIGVEPTWKVGDILAVYEFWSDYEGEYIYGKVEKVEFDEKNEDWKYLFTNDYFAYESDLIQEQAYRKNTK